MAWTEAPALAKAAGNSYSPRPTATAPVVDSTSNNCWDTSGPNGRFPQHCMDAFVHIARVDMERIMAATELAQPFHLRGILVADRVVTDRRIPCRSSLDHTSDRPAFGVVHPLRASEQVQVDAVLRDQKKTMDVLVDQGCFLRGPERRPTFGQCELGRLPRRTIPEHLYLIGHPDRPSGSSFHVLPSRVRPARFFVIRTNDAGAPSPPASFGRHTPHCLKWNATPASMH